MIFPQLSVHTLSAEFDCKSSSLPGFCDVNFLSANGMLYFFGWTSFRLYTGQDHLVQPICIMAYSFSCLLQLKLTSQTQVVKLRKPTCNLQWPV